VFARRSAFFGVRLLAHDLALTALAFPVAYLLRARLACALWHLGPIYPMRVYGRFILGVLVLLPIAGWALGVYRHVDPRQRWRVVRGAIVLIPISSTLVLAGLFLFHAEYISRSLVLAFWGVDVVFLVLGRIVLSSGGAWFRNRLDRYRHFLIVGTGGPARELAQYIEQAESLGDRLIGFAYTGAKPPTDLPGGYRLVSVGAVPELLETEPVDEIIFAVTHQELGQLEPVMRRCQEEGLHTRVHLDFLPLNVPHVYLEHLHDVPLLTFANAPDSEPLLFLKRALDVTLAGVLMVPGALLMLVIAALIRLTSPGPIIYRQTRCGIGGRRFTLYKFRSMVRDADERRTELEIHNEAEGPVFKMTNDPRVTAVGRWLRKFSLDELPQLWNILRGDMSFVGPRPPLPEEVARYEVWQRRRLRMRPGLTCLWALEGRSRVKFDRWMELDLAYIDNWSLWLDFKIFLKTIPQVFRGQGAF
jgi:exopolysaccharide biosynthesis polyprenyl glycosylphosphotransferase